MAFEIHRPQFQQSVYLASVVATTQPRVPVFWSVSDPLTVVPIASHNQKPAGWIEFEGNGFGASPGDRTTLYEEGNVVKAVAAASLGAGAEIVIGSTNGAMTFFAGQAGASGLTKWSLGMSETPAAAGEVFSLNLRFRQLSNLA